MYVNSGLQYHYIQGRSRKFRKRWLGHLPTCHLYIQILLIFLKFYKNTGNTEFKEKGGLSPLGPPLNPPLISFMCTIFFKLNLHGMTLMHVMCLPKAYNMSCLMKIKPRTYCVVIDFTQHDWCYKHLISFSHATKLQHVNQPSALHYFQESSQ